MASSKKSLVEQVMRRLASGDTSASQRVHPKEVERAIEQVINLKLKAQVFEGMSLDDTIPQGCMIASYDNVPVVSWMGVSKCTLPAIPISLPKGMGVWRIGPAYAATQTANYGDSGTTDTSAFVVKEFIVGTTAGAPISGAGTWQSALFMGRNVELEINRIPQSGLQLGSDPWFEKPLTSDTITLHGATFQTGDLLKVTIY